MGLIRCKSECTGINQWGRWRKPGSHAGFSYSGRMTLGGYRVGAALHFSYLAYKLLYITLNSVTFESPQKSVQSPNFKTLLHKVPSFNMVSILWSTICYLQVTHFWCKHIVNILLKLEIHLYFSVLIF